MSERKGTKALELWCKRLVKDCPDVQIDNMTTSWRNGIAFCALVHHFRPDLIDLSTLKPENVYENNQLAFSVAEKHLGIPALLDPEDMVDNDVPDRLSILTYLSQFYQRLGHTVNTKASSEVDSKSPSTSVSNTTPLRFGKSGLDKCAACALPVYLAQRLMVAHKLYHRRCFRCSKCSGHLNPKNFDISDGSEFTCDSCKNEKTLTKFLNNNDHDQMGMVAFSDDVKEVTKEESINLKSRARPLSILEKINMFEKNAEKDIVTDKIGNLHIKDNSNNLDISAPTPVIQASELSNDFNVQAQTETASSKDFDSKDVLQECDKLSLEELPSKVYKSSINKFNFLQTQLADGVLDNEITSELAVPPSTESNIEDCSQKMDSDDVVVKHVENENSDAHKGEGNITDDIRLAIGHNIFPTVDDTPSEKVETPKHEREPGIGISVPPRRKKQLSSPNKVLSTKPKKENIKPPIKDYPDHLNPFSDNEEEEDTVHDPSKKNSTNPFGSSDEEDDDLPSKHAPPGAPEGANVQQPTPGKRLIKAFNPFWSDDEEPSTDDEDRQKDSMYKSSLATSTPNLPADTPRRKKAKAPPPPVIRVSGTPLDQPCTSMDDVASISSLSSFNSTIHSDQKSYGISTPLMKKKRPAPTLPDSLSTVSGGGGSLEKDVDTSGIHSNISDSGRRAKGPAPGLPLPERRAVRLALTPEQLQAQLDLLETQQLGLERQGVLIEQMIRDKCEGDEPSLVPQEEVEDLVIQLCELVNEKNDLFRKQTELMYIRRQQRLEQEQADIEHEIRIIQSRPAVNRIDADKAREEQLVSRLVQIVRLRDELVQQLDCERRRERQEDRAIAVCIAHKRAQRNSESNSSSMKSVEVVPTPKKNKVKDKVKKQLKKAKHTLYSKKKEDGPDKKEEKTEKEKKPK